MHFGLALSILSCFWGLISLILGFVSKFIELLCLGHGEEVVERQEGMWRFRWGGG